MNLISSAGVVWKTGEKCVERIEYSDVFAIMVPDGCAGYGFTLEIEMPGEDREAPKCIAELLHKALKKGGYIKKGWHFEVRSKSEHERQVAIADLKAQLKRLEKETTE